MSTATENFEAELEKRPRNCPTETKIIHSEAALQAVLARWRFRSQQIVFTNGCFDLLHLGHTDYLEKARALGHRLVVGINSDDSVRRLKGPERPLQPLEARARVLAALQFVDLVVSFAEDDPLQLILAVQPDILVKGDDYTLEQIIGAKEVRAAGGRVQTLPLVEGYSTTQLLARLQKGAGH